jgi:hypothetical protein
MNCTWGSLISSFIVSESVFLASKIPNISKENESRISPVFVKTSVLGVIFEILNLKKTSKIKNREKGIVEKLGKLLLNNPAIEKQPRIINIEILKYLMIRLV